MKIIINENEKDQISSQHEEIDRSLFNFLLRRIKIEKRNLNSNWLDEEPLEVTEYKFEGYPGHGFNNYDSKKSMETKIIGMLYENDITDYIYDMDEQNPKRVKIVKTVRKFLNFILSEQK